MMTKYFLQGDIFIVSISLNSFTVDQNNILFFSMFFFPYFFLFLIGYDEYKGDILWCLAYLLLYGPGKP